MTDPLSDTVRMIENWERDAEEKAARFQAMSDRVEQISITESVGPVSVTVGHNGIPTDITMADGAREMEPREIAANVMAAMRKAQSRYPAQLAEILAETVGDDDPAGQHIVATAERNFPAPEEEETDEDPMRFSDVEVDEQPPPPSPPRPQHPAPPRARDDEDDDGDVTIFRE